MNAMKHHWTDGVAYGFDTETTSADPLEAHIITAALVKFENGVAVDKREWLLNPEAPVGASEEIHGFSDEFLKANGSDYRTGVREIADMIAMLLKGRKPLIVVNAAYDLTVLEKQLADLKLPTLTERVPYDTWVSVVDPQVLARGVEHFIRREFVKGRNFKLESLAERYEIPFDGDAHTAAADATVGALLAFHLTRSTDELRKLGPLALTALQKEWRERQQKALHGFFTEKAIKENTEVPERFDYNWPLYVEDLAFATGRFVAA